MFKDKEYAKSVMNEKKSQGAEEERLRRREDEELIKRVRSIQLAENQLKAKQIKKIELETEERMRQFNQSRVAFSKKNHLNKVEKCLSERSKMESTLQKLRSHEKKLIDDCKQSEADMMSSLY